MVIPSALPPNLASTTAGANLVPPAGLWPSGSLLWLGPLAEEEKGEMHREASEAICLPEHPLLVTPWGPLLNTTGDNVWFPVRQRDPLAPPRTETRSPAPLLGVASIPLAWGLPWTKGRLPHCPLPEGVWPSGTPPEHVPITEGLELCCKETLNVTRLGGLCMTLPWCCPSGQSHASPEAEAENGLRPEIPPPVPADLCVLLSTRHSIAPVLDCLARQHPSLPVKHLLLSFPLNIPGPV